MANDEQLGASPTSGEDETRDGVSPAIRDVVSQGLRDFAAGMNDDLNTPRCAHARVCVYY